MAAMLETPSRVWRRIEAVESKDMPSLPSLPAFDDSQDASESDTNLELNDESQDILPIHSTPALSTHTQTTIRAPSSTSSTARFAYSIASRSSKSALSASSASAVRPPPEESFDVSDIPSLPDVLGAPEYDDDLELRSSDQETEESSLPKSPPPLDASASQGFDRDLDISEALRSISRPNSPEGDAEPTPQKKYDYSPSPFDKMRNVSLRRPLSRTRTPSLTRATPSPSSLSSTSTPHSTRSMTSQRHATASPSPAAVPLPRSATASPALIPLPPSANVSPAVPDTGVSYMTGIGDSSDAHEESRDDMDLTDTMSQEMELRDSGNDTREPTFSSETSSQAAELPASHSPRGLSVAFSSPAPSAIFTPTPAFQPRPRARFAAALPLSTPRPVQYNTQDATPAEQDDDDLATPSAHKRSFLLSVINSTARPRIGYTPHPHRAGNGVPGPMTPGVNLQAAFAGVTPRPRTQVRPRLSYPVAQAPSAPSDSGSASGAESLSDTQSHSPIASGSESPYDGNADRVSIISTASSQDLTTHARANASFDPVMGLGERGHGVGRFNAGKLNNYLHGLNRRLQEENETLVFRLRTYEEKYGKGGMAEQASEAGTPQISDRSVSSRRSSAGRRVSAGPSLGLGDVPEEVAEGWLEEKAALQEEIEELKEELEQHAAAQEEVEQALEQEKGKRVRDKQEFEERIRKVDKGVSDIVQKLEDKLADAEGRLQAAERSRAANTRDLERRIENAGHGKRAAGGQSEERRASVGRRTRTRQQIKELEIEVMTSDGRIDDLEGKLHKEREARSIQEDELHATQSGLEDASNRVNRLTEDLDKAHKELRAAETYASQLDSDTGDAVARVESLEAQVAAAQDLITAMEEDAGQDELEMNRLSAEAKQAAELGRQMQQALEAAEARIVAKEQDIASLQAALASAERAADRSRSKSAVTQSDSSYELRADVDALEEELATAHKEISRLKTLISQSPARKAIDKAKDAKISLLEREKTDLLERLKTNKANTSLHGTPSKVANASGLSPLHRQLLALKSPKTPGGPLRDLSWLQTTMNDPSVSPLVAEIARLQQQLDRANQSIDDKLDQLEDAGLGVVGLTTRLEDARERIVTLEDEIARLTRKEGRLQRRLQRVRCTKCRTKVDLRGLLATSVGDESSILEESHMSLISEPPTPPTKTSEALRVQLQQVNTQLASMRQQWEDEKRQLLGDNAVLQDAANRLNTQVRDTKRELKKLADTGKAGEHARASVQEELDNARRVIDELENELTAERARLRTLSTEQSRVQREKEQVAYQLRRTESDMTDVRSQLQTLKQENQELSSHLRSSSVAEQKARLFESKVSENAEMIEQLRHERSLLAAEHKELQRRYSKISEHVNQVREEHAASQVSHDERRHQLDLRLLEIDDLKRALSEQASELLRTETERNRIAAEKSDVARSVAALEADLQRVRRDAEMFGRDLKLLRAQKDRLEDERRLEQTKAERAQKQAQTQIRVLKEELDGQKEKARVAAEQLQKHVCVVYVSSHPMSPLALTDGPFGLISDEQQLVELNKQHKNECKGLMLQIRYLKAKFTRESGLRSDLGYQKQYLLVLLTHYERTEHRILAAIARIGFPAADPPVKAKRRTLRSVAMSIAFIARSRRAAESWREQRASKDAIAAALQEVRQRRTTAGGGRATHS
ncbi:hypothetical protein EVJ58_g7633 [Rhodofomes roseus]|uniref:Pericentrin/AKAP-450 centrosomal targeting domain-containing protein n=1 Tax=Rhodofomes roseus TaxID=34475 RepID=A0A4Y9Y1Y0_9APHY|nr:hypothetical protein EVJ58_g7633 [Rhodofomes roseus]